MDGSMLYSFQTLTLGWAVAKAVAKQSKHAFLTVQKTDKQRCSTWYLYLYSSSTRVLFRSTCTRTRTCDLSTCTCT